MTERKDGVARPEPLGMRATPKSPEAPKYVVFDRAEFVQWWLQPEIGATNHGIPMPGEIIGAVVVLP